jgi:hypothetical protein
VTDTPIDDRRFSDREVREILERAVRKTTSRELVRSGGHSLSDLKAIAREVGIDPHRLEEAAREVVRESINKPNPILGASLHLDIERSVDGVVDPDDLPRILTSIRRVTGHQGEAADIHGSLEWSTKSELIDRHVSLYSKDGVTTIRGSANLTNAAFVTYLPAGILGSMAAFISIIVSAQEGNPIALVMGLAVLVVLFPVLRTILGRISKSEAAKLERIVAELAQFAEAPDDE